jgi:hypothetical protein
MWYSHAALSAERAESIKIKGKSTAYKYGRTIPMMSGTPNPEIWLTEVEFEGFTDQPQRDKWPIGKSSASTRPENHGRNTKYITYTNRSAQIYMLRAFSKTTQNGTLTTLKIEVLKSGAGLKTDIIHSSCRPRFSNWNLNTIGITNKDKIKPMIPHSKNG